MRDSNDHWSFCKTSRKFAIRKYTKQVNKKEKPAQSFKRPWNLHWLFAKIKFIAVSWTLFLRFSFALKFVYLEMYFICKAPWNCHVKQKRVFLKIIKRRKIHEVNLQFKKEFSSHSVWDSLGSDVGKFKETTTSPIWSKLGHENFLPSTSIYAFKCCIKFYAKVWQWRCLKGRKSLRAVCGCFSMLSEWRNKDYSSFWSL